MLLNDKDNSLNSLQLKKFYDIVLNYDYHIFNYIFFIIAILLILLISLCSVLVIFQITDSIISLNDIINSSIKRSV